MMISAKKSGDGCEKRAECGDGGELKVLICGQQLDGTITPILVDADGKIVLST